MSFDPYSHWLGIPQELQPPTHYALLGLAEFETDPKKIANAFQLRYVTLRPHAIGTHSDLSQKLMNELAAAKVCLLNPNAKADYDQRLRSSLKVASPPAEVVSKVASHVATVVSAVETSPSKQEESPSPHRRRRTVPLRRLRLFARYACRSASKAVQVRLVKWRVRERLANVDPLLAGLGIIAIAVCLVVFALIMSHKPIENIVDVGSIEEESDDAETRSSPDIARKELPSDNDTIRTDSNEVENLHVVDDSVATTPAFVRYKTGRFHAVSNRKYAIIEQVGDRLWVERFQSDPAKPVQCFVFKETRRDQEALILQRVTSDQTTYLKIENNQLYLSWAGGDDWRALEPGSWIAPQLPPRSLKTSLAGKAGASLDVIESTVASRIDVFGKTHYDPTLKSLQLFSAMTCFPVDLPRNYQLRVRVKRLESDMGLSIGLRCQDTPIWLVLDHTKATHLTGVNGIMGESVFGGAFTPYRTSAECFPIGKEVALIVDISEDLIRVSADGKIVLDYPPRPLDLQYPGLNYEAPYPEHLWFSCAGAIELSDIEITQVVSNEEAWRATSLAAARKQPGESLFDGRSLDNWEDPQGVFEVRSDGSVGPRANSSAKGHLYTKKSFDDFELDCEFKFLSTTGVESVDSGIFWGFDPPWGGGSLQYNIEYKGFGLFAGQLSHLGGVPEPAAISTLRLNDWNHLRLRKWGDTVESYVNGVKAKEMCTNVPEHLRAGRISLERWEGDFAVRSVKLRRLPPIPDAFLSK